MVFRKIHEEKFSSEEMSQVLVGGTVERRGAGRTEAVFKWETLVPSDLAPEAVPDPRNGGHLLRGSLCGRLLGSDGSMGWSKYGTAW